MPTGVSGGDKPQKKGKAEVKEALRRLICDFSLGHGGYFELSIQTKFKRRKHAEEFVFSSCWPLCRHSRFGVFSLFLIGTPEVPAVNRFAWAPRLAGRP